MFCDVLIIQSESYFSRNNKTGWSSRSMMETRKGYPLLALPLICVIVFILSFT